MRALRMYGTRDMRLEEMEKPACGPGQVLLKSLYCGICGSDVPRVFGGDLRMSPEAIGHEFSARVEAVGAGVEGLCAGDLVVVAPLLVCHECPDCLSGHFGQCRSSRFIGASFADVGGLIEYNAIDARNAMKLPEGIDPRRAAFVEPLSVALHGLYLMGFAAGKELAVVGAGTIGLLVVQAAKALGAGRVHVFDLNDDRLDRARRHGADEVYNTAREGFFEAYLEGTGGRGCPQVVEAVGEPETIHLALRAADTAADVAIIGTMHHDVTLPPELFYGVFSRRQLNVHGVWMSYSDDFPGREWRDAARLIAQGSVDVDGLTERVVELEDAYEALLAYTRPGGVSGKILVRVARGEHGG